MNWGTVRSSGMLHRFPSAHVFAHVQRETPGPHTDEKTLAVNATRFVAFKLESCRMLSALATVDLVMFRRGQLEFFRVCTGVLPFISHGLSVRCKRRYRLRSGPGITEAYFYQEKITPWASAPTSGHTSQPSLLCPRSRD